MSPLTLSDPRGPDPTTYSQLLDSLGAQPHPALIFYGADDSRVELSGRVLANWAVKLIGLFGEEYQLGEDDTVRVDAAPHWKPAAVVLAAGAMGAAISLQPRAAAPGGGPRVIVTDRPGTWIGSQELDGAETGRGAELAAVSPGMLDASFEEATGESIPAWVLDISADAPQQPDQLPSPLTPVSLPHAAEAPPGTLVLTAWDQESAALMVGTWAKGGVVVIFAGEARGERWERMRRNEGLD